jgi:hypothetical protein
VAAGLFAIDQASKNPAAHVRFRKNFCAKSLPKRFSPANDYSPLQHLKMPRKILEQILNLGAAAEEASL